MRVQQITSTKNPLVQRVRETARGEVESQCVAEGVRLVRDAIRADVPMPAAVYSPRLTARAAAGGFDLRRRLEQLAEQCFECTDAVLARMSALGTHQGVLVILERPRWRPADLLVPAPALVVAAAGVRDPGNLGAMIRTAEAGAATGFVAIRGGADPFREKAVRGSAGSVLRLPLLSGLDAAAVIALAREHGLQLVVSDQSAEQDYLDAGLVAPSLLVLGSEGAGLPESLIAAGDLRVRIPMREPVDSLNVAVATGVLLYEARRQRR